MRAIAIDGRRSGIIRCSKTISPAELLSWAIPTPSPTCLSGVGSTVHPPRVLKGEGDPLAPYPNIKRWFAAIDARPAVARARTVGTDHAFKQERDEEALRALFPSNYPAVV